jgi:RNA polymerase sigma factor (sigma-70 family)
MAAETLSGIPDQQLLERFSAGRDEAAFEAIVRRHGPMVYRVCQRVMRRAEDTEDAFQATFLLLAQKAASIRKLGSLACWLHGVARRVALKARAAEQTRRRHEQQACCPSRAVPLEDITWGELHAVLDEELDRLPEKWRGPLVLCYQQGRTQDEAARQLGWSRNTFSRRMAEARQALARRLIRRGWGLPAALGAALFADVAVAAPTSLIRSTVAAGVRAGADRASTAALSARVVALMEGVKQAMFVSNAKLAAAFLLAIGVLATGLGLLAHQTLAARAADEALAAPSSTTPAADPSAAPPASETKPPPARQAPDNPVLALRPRASLLKGHEGTVNAIAFSPNGKAVATAGDDKTVRVWDLATGRQIHKLDQPDKAIGVAFSPDGKALATTSAIIGALVLWDPDAGKQRWRTPVKREMVRGPDGKQREEGFALTGPIAFSPDSKIMAVALEQGVAVAIHVATGKDFMTFKGRALATTAAAISTDGKLLVLGNSSGDVDVLDLGKDGNWKNLPGKKAVTALAFLGLGTRVAVADGGKAVRILDVTKPLPPAGMEELAFVGRDPIRALAVSAAGKWAATASADGTVRLWDTEGRKEKRRLQAWEGVVKAMAFSPDGKRLGMVGKDGAIIWDLTRDDKPLPGDLKLTQKAMDGLWADLASDVGSKVFLAALRLRADPGRSVPFLRDHIQRKGSGPDQKKIQQLITELDSDDFKKRASASKGLEEAGKAAETAILDALAAKPSLEVKTRLERLLKQAQQSVLSAEQQRDVRAVRVLEQAGTAESRKLLEALSKESPCWWISREAKAALLRLAGRDKKS